MGRARKFRKTIEKGKLFRPKRTRIKIMLVFFAVLSVEAILGVYFTHSLLAEEKNIITLTRYRHVSEYDYIARLRPNEIYENRLTLGPGEGALYINIVENVNITFHYRFIFDHPASITTEYSVGMDLESPGKWVKHLTVVPENSVSSSGEEVEFSAELFITPTLFEELKTIIDTEIGVSTSTYNLRVKPEIRTLAETDVGTIDESLVPELVINFKWGAAEGNQIVMSDLEDTTSGIIQRTETIYDEGVLTYRRIFYLMSALAFLGLIGTTSVFMRTGLKRREKVVEAVIEPFKEAIMEVAKEPSYKDQRATIAMKSLEDLVSLAEGLGKPVLYLRKPPHIPGAGQMHTFYVLDGVTRYEYSFKLSGKSGPKA